MRGRRTVAVALLMFALVVGVDSAVAAPRTWEEGGTVRAFSVGSHSNTVAGTVRGSAGVALARGVVWEYKPGGADPFEPFSIQLLTNGNLLVATRANRIIEITPGKRIAWSYSRVPDNPDLVNTYSARRLSNGNTLIADRRADFVIEINSAKQVVWRYGVNQDSLEPGSLVDPFYAERLPNGNTLITDNRGGNRIIEVRTSDYDPDAPNMGYSSSSIVWQYGVDGVGGATSGRLASPRRATRLSNGNTLITDSSEQNFSGERIIEVTPGGSIAWQYGVGGQSGKDEGYTYKPSAAYRLSNGNTLIVEEDGNRMLEVSPAGKLVEVYSADELIPEGGGISKVRDVARAIDGTAYICDQANNRIIGVGYSRDGRMTSAALNLGMPGVLKTISRIEYKADSGDDTEVKLQYSLDGGKWTTVPSDGDLPKGSVAKQVRYRALFSTESAAYSPVLRTVEITYDVAPTAEKKESNTSGNGNRGSGNSGNQNGSGGSGSGSGDGGSDSGNGGSDGSADDGAGAGGAESPISATADGADGFASGTLLQPNGSGAEVFGFGVQGDGGGYGTDVRALLLLGLLFGAGYAAAPVAALAGRATSSIRSTNVTSTGESASGNSSSTDR